MMRAVSELWRYRSLLYVIVRRDIRVKYKQSIMGFMWAILMPSLIVMVGLLVRYVYSQASSTELNTADISSIALRSLPWALTVGAIRFGTSSLIGNASLVTKIYFPKEVLPIAAVGANLFDFCIAAIPLSIFMILVGGQLSVHLLWLPLLICILLSIITGVVLFVSAASLFFRDVKYLVEVALTFGIFLTPVFFTVSMFETYSSVMMLNPLSAVLEALDSTVIHGQPPQLLWLGYSFGFGLISMGMGYLFFKRLEPAFAESI